MAAACSLGCSSASCACNRQGKWSDPSLLEKRLSEDSRRHRLLQQWTSMSSADAAEAEAEPEPCGEKAAAAAAAAAAGENPLVFLCSRCRRPLGDSLTWVTSQEDSNCILLRCVSSNVSVDKEQKLSKCEGEDGCILETLYCTGCSLRLGYVYRCTPKNLDYKRDLFCLSVEAIESYTLGSSEKQILSEDKELLNLESRVEIEKSIKQMEDVLKALQTKLWEVESKLSLAGCCR
ncbi:protein Mis18-alpha [Peromyscus californicus insignis]|uniref:protein Mis18-alpha n=1 Tax=Peromyscus californicus insignis TaxID=564181 RepID=UPI0022A79035|nr:protein Mis18-alpha [Peromyscus californicus insignis]XP_052597074.1 protein Mis18-alpha [Peromyscus californicus insignis]XP_052597075.1 protein Mis18-alpha [Peromyscus californicus insignis]